MKSFCEKAIEFYSDLSIPGQLPAGVKVLNPYKKPEVLSIVRDFFRKFYNEGRDRVIILGINPGRFGAGITGITFTDPVRLEQDCGIPNSFEKRSELSSRFVYELIHAFGGTVDFFKKFFLSAVCPLGFIKSGKNLNYYDERNLEDSLSEFITNTLHRQCELGIRRDIAICLGEGRNFKYLRQLNQETELFNDILPLPHPRWVMQYRYRQKDVYIHDYLKVLRDLREPGSSNRNPG